MPPSDLRADVPRVPSVAPLATSDAAAALEALTRAEAAVGGELVDEAERRRLEALAGPDAVRPDGWHPVVARRGTELVGYGAFTSPTQPGEPANGDATAIAGADHVADRVADVTGADHVVDGTGEAATTLTSLLDHLAAAAADAGAGRLVVWVRRVDDRLTEAAAAAGFHPARTLGVLGRALPTGEPVPPPPPGVTIRSYTRDDDVEVVRVLRGAYAGTDDGGWDLDAFRTRTGWDWFRPDDLLVAEDDHEGDGAGDGAGDGRSEEGDGDGRSAEGDGARRLLGLHWLKRRDATTGEVHNLAIHPDAQGRGLGPVLLHAGLDHLASTGCDEVLLWVDRANDRAVRLYTREGFTTRWDDVAFARELGSGAGRQGAA